MVYKFEPLEDGAISISTDAPDSSVYEIYFDGLIEDLMERIYANENFEIIECVRLSELEHPEPSFGIEISFNELTPAEWEIQF